MIVKIKQYILLFAIIFFFVLLLGCDVPSSIDSNEELEVTDTAGACGNSIYLEEEVELENPVEELPLYEQPEENDEPAAVRLELKDNQLMVLSNWARLREAADEDRDVIRSLWMGSVVEVVEGKRGWIKVISADSDTGWVKAEELMNREQFEDRRTFLRGDVEPKSPDPDDVVKFVEDVTRISHIAFILPEFEDPLELSNEHLLTVALLNWYTGKHIVPGEVVNYIINAIFGPEVKIGKHESMPDYDWNSEYGFYTLVGYGTSQYTKTEAINVSMQGDLYLVDINHTYHWQIHADVENVTTHRFPLRRYIVKRTGDDSYYIKASHIIDN